MKVVTWNVNGLRAILSRNPKLQSVQNLLTTLQADVVCLQETKLAKDDLDRMHYLGMVEGWESYFSFCRTRSNYSGVVTYCKYCIQPHAAEEGLCGTLECSPAVAAQRMHFDADDAFWNRYKREDLQQIDLQGRCMITDHGAFVLFNVYGPAVTDVDNPRFANKIVLYEVLQYRINRMLAAGRRVVVAGDLNIALKPLDHCDYVDALPAKQAAFLRRRADRVLLGSMMADQGGPLHDVLRQFHPGKRWLYTVWPMKLHFAHGARPRSRGSRVDYIIAAAPKRLGPASEAVAPSSDSTTHEQSDQHQSNGTTALSSGHISSDMAPSNSNAKSSAQPLASVDLASESPSARRQPTPGAAKPPPKPTLLPFGGYSFVGCSIMRDCDGSDHVPVVAELDLPPQPPPARLPELCTRRLLSGGQQQTLHSWLSIGKRKSSSASEDRPGTLRRIDQQAELSGADTPPRNPLDELP